MCRGKRLKVELSLVLLLNKQNALLNACFVLEDYIYATPLVNFVYKNRGTQVRSVWLLFLHFTRCSRTENISITTFCLERS